MIDPIDQVRLSFDQNQLALLNAILGLVMFGVALDLKLGDFRRALGSGRPAAAGLACQFLLLPAATFGLVSWLEPPPSVALGMFLVAACPGGNTSNFMTHLAGGNTALSVSLSAISTVAATVVTPANLAFWASLYPPTRALLVDVALDPVRLAVVVATILGLPVALGMVTAARLPAVARRLRRPLRALSVLIFFGFVVAALAANWHVFREHVGRVAGLVVLHNGAALLTGYGAGRLLGVGERDRRALSIEVGIQNTALGLVLIFDFFHGLGGMTLVAAWWGIWHLVSGLAVAAFWSRRPAASAEPTPA
ncbi:MAG: bile acid:sodium symporter family protein [Acidobacteriota bacterium]